MVLPEHAAYLREVARSALVAAVERRPADALAPPPREWAPLWADGGVFVTLRTQGRLRGCLGCFSHNPPLYRTVATYATFAATDDPRFRSTPLRPDELPDVAIEISLLSPLVPCQDPMAIEPGRHGISLKKNTKSGCFLPQVATEAGWDAAEFWERCCVDKAGLPSGVWRDADTERWTFTTEVIA